MLSTTAFVLVRAVQRPTFSRLLRGILRVMQCSILMEESGIIKAGLILLWIITHSSLLLGQWGIVALLSFFALCCLHTLFLVITLFSASPVNTCFFYFLHPPLLLSSSSVCPVSRWKQVYTRRRKINNREIDSTVVLILINRRLICERIDRGTCPVLWLFRMAWV